MQRKSIIIMTICLFLALNTTAQEEASVEKSIFGIQAGIMGIWANNEKKLSNTIALRSEIGFEMTGGTINDRKDAPIIPLVLTVEPRYYYDIKKRHSKGLRIDNNSATFISVKISYHADWLMLSGKQPGNIQIMPTYAGRGCIGKHFNYEVGGGIGYQYTFTSIEKQKNDWSFNIVLRIGYTF